MRNPFMMDILKGYRYEEARGMGIRRTVVPQVREVTIFQKSYKYPEST